MINLEYLLIIVSILLIASIVTSKTLGRYGIPALLLFLVIGMLAGSEGFGGISFDSPVIAQYVGVVALVFILFSGGLETDMRMVKPVFKEGAILATAGVLLTAILVGAFSMFVLKFSFIEGLLLASIVSSTDAAAVFSILRSKKISLKHELAPLLEFESGSNDPMAVFLTIGFISILTGVNKSIYSMIPLFFIQMGLGAIIGYFAGKGIVYFVNKVHLEYDGLYPVLSMALILLTYAFTVALQGSGFLAIYIVGLIIGNSNIAQKRNLIHFHSGLAWLMQIAMFLTLGLLVFPSRLLAIAGPGLLITLFLMFVARPLSVFISLYFSKFTFRYKAFISWVGLRGSVPIILATFPLIAGIDKSDTIFNIVFFIVLLSTLLQGTSIPSIAKLLGVDAPFSSKHRYPIEFEHTDDLNTRLMDFTIPYDSWMNKKTIAEISLPDDSLITLVVRNDDFIVPSGKTIIESGDVLLILVNNNNLTEIQSILSRKKE